MSEQEQPRKPNLKTDVATPALSGEIAADIRALIEAARLRVVQTVNAELVLLNWQIRNRIRRDILGEGRARYGEEMSLRCRDN
jgi:hypothetical protein